MDTPESAPGEQPADRPVGAALPPAPPDWNPATPPDLPRAWSPDPVPAPVWPAAAAPVGPASPRGARRPAWLTEAALTTLVAAVITLTSIVVALTAWRGSVAANRASFLDGATIQQTAMRQQELETIAGDVALDLRLLPRYQQHVLAAAQLQAAAAALPAGSAERNLLEVQAQGERAIARVMRSFFTALPSVDASGLATYDRDFVLRTLQDQDVQLADLRPDLASVSAAQAHDQTNSFVLVGVLLAAALVLLTTAQVTRGRRRLPFFAGGGALAVIGALGLVLVEAVLYRGG